MKFRYNDDTKVTDIWAETDDICLFCALFDYCPLLGALEINLVYPSADRITVAACSIYHPEGVERN